MIKLSAYIFTLFFVRLSSAAPAVSGPAIGVTQFVVAEIDTAQSSTASVVAPSLSANAVQSTATGASAPSATVSYISLNPNKPLWNETNGDPQPIRGSLGASVMGPTNTPVAKQNPDILAPPTTDHEMAGVDMRLKAGAIRELHWHQTSEWSFVIKGSVQITAVDAEGRNYNATVGPGDLWYFPPGIPHSLQATGDDPEGAEFLLVFDSGEFNDDDTFLVG
ncbi:hypothetical protein H0H87_002813 [Tephrocybe sp. NHM501043]|nr:hypothetical protein H0H87_002813 [Tephrocybe sp. NHM501043]